jgi:hypothetical protein
MQVQLSSMLKEAGALSTFDFALWLTFHIHRYCTRSPVSLAQRAWGYAASNWWTVFKRAFFLHCLVLVSNTVGYSLITSLFTLPYQIVHVLVKGKTLYDVIVSVMLDHALNRVKDGRSMRPMKGLSTTCASSRRSDKRRYASRK